MVSGRRNQLDLGALECDQPAVTPSGKSPDDWARENLRQSLSRSFGAGLQRLVSTRFMHWTGLRFGVKRSRKRDGNDG